MSPNLLLSFDLSLSCKLQLIDLIMVSAACLAGRQTILICFFPRELWVHRKRKETNGRKIKNATRRFLVQIHPSRFVSKVVCPVPNIAIEAGMFFFQLYFTSNGHAKTIISRRALMIIWYLECWKWHFRASRFQNFLGEHAPRPP